MPDEAHALLDPDVELVGNNSVLLGGGSPPARPKLRSAMTRGQRAIAVALGIGVVVGTALLDYRPQPYRPPAAPPVATTTARPALPTAASRDLWRLPLVPPTPSPSAVVSTSPPAVPTVSATVATVVAARPVVANTRAVGQSQTFPASPTTGRAKLPPTAAQWAKLRYCESRGNYADKYNSKYRGGYQIGYREWQGMGYTGDPADATPALQDEAALRLWQARGWSPWYSSSSCSHLR